MRNVISFEKEIWDGAEVGCAVVDCATGALVGGGGGGIAVGCAIGAHAVTIEMTTSEKHGEYRKYRIIPSFVEEQNK